MSLPPIPSAEPPTLWACFRSIFRKGKFSDFSGRAGRREYWGSVLYSSLLYVAISVPIIVCGIGYAAVLHTDADEGVIVGWALALMAALILLLVAVLYTFTPLTALWVRRLHDVNWSGWWIVLHMVLGTIGLVTAVAAAMSEILLLAESGPMSKLSEKLLEWKLEAIIDLNMLPANILGILLFILTILPGQKCPNRFGNPT